MNETILLMKQMKRAMNPYVLLIYEMVLESKPVNVLEIGTGQCQSSRSILSAMKENQKGLLTSVDMRDRSDRIDEELKQYFRQIVGNSHSEDIKKLVSDVQYGLLLIDGDHSYEGAKRDFEMYVPLLKDGGLILMHDIINSDCGVKDFWKEIKYPKIALNYGLAKNGSFLVGMGIVQKYDETI